MAKFHDNLWPPWIFAQEEAEVAEETKHMARRAHKSQSEVNERHSADELEL